MRVSLAQGQGGTPVDKQRVWGDHWQLTAQAACAGLILKEVHEFFPPPGYTSCGYKSMVRFCPKDVVLCERAGMTACGVAPRTRSFDFKTRWSTCLFRTTEGSALCIHRRGRTTLASGWGRALTTQASSTWQGRSKLIPACASFRMLTSVSTVQEHRGSDRRGALRPSAADISSEHGGHGEDPGDIRRDSFVPRDLHVRT